MRIASFALAPYDRSVRIDFRSSRPDAEHERTSLYAELFGRHANLIYVDGEGTILCPLRVVSPEESRIREVSPGLPYRPLPRPARVFLPEVTPEDAARIHAGGVEGLARALQDSVAGLGREVAHEAAARGKESPEALFSALRELVRRYEENDFAPGVGTLPDGKRRILPFPCPAAGFAEFEPHPSANDAADIFYAGVSEARELAVLRQQLASRIAALLKKERHKLENVGGDEERLVEGLAGGAHGETLKANLGELSKGMSSFRGIPLDPAMSPVENMNRYFRLARKAKNATEIVRKRKREVAEGDLLHRIAGGPAGRRAHEGRADRGPAGALGVLRLPGEIAAEEEGRPGRRAQAGRPPGGDRGVPRPSRSSSAGTTSGTTGS